MANQGRGKTIEIRGDEVAAPVPIHRDRTAYWVKVWCDLGPSMGLDQLRLYYDGQEVARLGRGRPEADPACSDGTGSSAPITSLAQDGWWIDPLRRPLQRQARNKD